MAVTSAEIAAAFGVTKEDMEALIAFGIGGLRERRVDLLTAAVRTVADGEAALLEGELNTTVETVVQPLRERQTRLCGEIDAVFAELQDLRARVRAEPTLPLPNLEDIRTRLEECQIPPQDV